jgi:hypothetical protein
VCCTRTTRAEGGEEEGRREEEEGHVLIKCDFRTCPSKDDSSTSNQNERTESNKSDSHSRFVIHSPNADFGSDFDEQVSRGTTNRLQLNSKLITGRVSFDCESLQGQDGQGHEQKGEEECEEQLGPD